jgi:protein O-GlcNAc transferase
MNNPQFLLEQGFKNQQAGRLEQAENFYRQALKADPHNPDGLHLLGLVVNETGDPNEAIKLLAKAVKADPANAEISNNLGQLYKTAGRLDKAAGAYRAAIKADPNFSDAHSNLGNALVDDGKIEDAIGHYQKALDLDPDNARAHYNLATTLSGRSEHSAAIERFRRVIKLAPDYAEAHNNLAFCLIEQGATEEASDHLEKALQLDPRLAVTHCNIANLYALISEWESSLDHYTQATRLEPNRADAWAGLGNAQENLGLAEDALESFRNAVEADPDNPAAVGSLCFKLMSACAWADLAPLQDRLDGLNRQTEERGGKSGENPLTSLTRSTDLEKNFRIARSWGRAIESAVRGMDVDFPIADRRQAKSVLTIGYLSSDFRDHVVAHLTQRMFAMHDRDAFRVIGYSNGADDGSDYRRIIQEGCDEFVDIRGMPGPEAAARIHADRVDILVDLNGFTAGARPEIAALRPAPLQIHYLGYPGTVGADFFDYTILDDVVLDQEEEAFFSEKIITLPPCYMIHDRLAVDPSDIPGRADLGLPADAIVFCSFNKANKIEPVMFKCWMELLKETPGSVLWLSDNNPVATGNLKREAEARGVEPGRLVFAARVPSRNQHLARLSVADIGLDTRIYNGHVTTSDALAAGVPVITLRGGHVPSRATASMLTALGIPELITQDLDAYRTLALELAGNRDELERIKGIIAEKSRASALFDTEAKVRLLERAYRRIWDDFANGKEPQSVRIDV